MTDTGTDPITSGRGAPSSTPQKNPRLSVYTLHK